MGSLAIQEDLSHYAEDAAFKWYLRQFAVHAPHRSLEDLDQLDESIEAYIDGLRIGGDEGWAECLKAMASGEPDELFPGAVLAFGVPPVGVRELGIDGR